MKKTRSKVWDQICDIITIGWRQLIRYQKLKEKVNSSSHRLNQFDHEMQNKVNNAKDMLIALEELTLDQLETIGIRDRAAHMKSIHRVIRKAALIEESRALTKELGIFCHKYRERFEKCFTLGLPAIFSRSRDIYDEEVYLQRLHITMREDHDIFKSIPGQVEARDINLVLKSSYDILFGLKEIFREKEQPEYKRGAELCLLGDVAEEFKYPMGKEWHLLLHCVRVYKQNMGIHDPPLPHQQVEASSQAQDTTKGISTA